MNQEKTGQLIKEARKEKRLTQEDIANKLNISPKSVSKWERGINFPDSAMLPTLAEMLGLTVDELINGQRKKKPSKLKKNLSKLLLIFLLLVNFSVIGLLSYSCYRNYNKSRFYLVRSVDDEYNIKGYLSCNYEHNLFVIESISYQGKLFGTKDDPLIKNSQLSILSGEENNYVIFNEDTEEKLLNKYFDNIKIILKDKEYDIDNTYISIKYGEEEIRIKLYFDEVYANNKLFN